MGAWPARITRADFVTPGCSGAEAGRVGGVRLELVRTPRGTSLGRVYQQVPLRVMPAFCFHPDGAALLYLLNPTAGLFEGDAQLIEITAGAGSRALVTGQSATRIHPSLGRFALQEWRIRVCAGATLVVLPGPAIPFAGCRYAQRVEVDLEEGATFRWGDIWFAGRYARGDQSEQFRFATLRQDLKVWRAGQLVFRDRFTWHGPWDSTEATWHFGGDPACGTLFSTGPPSIPSADFADERVSCAGFLTAAGDRCLRWRGGSEEVTAALVRTACETAPSAATRGERTRFLEENHLAPNHWFSPWF